MHLLPINDGNERAGFPSASEYDRLLQCRASYLLSRKAYALGQVAHQWSPEADLGTRKHLANTEGPEGVSQAERADWEACQPSAVRLSRAGFATPRNHSLRLKKNVSGCAEVSGRFLPESLTKSCGKATEPRCSIINTAATVLRIQPTTSK